MLKKSASGVLASLRGSTLKRTFQMSETLAGLIRSPRSIRGVNGHTKCGLYLLASSLAAALLGIRRVSARRGWAGEKGGLFEHPEVIEVFAPAELFHQWFMHKPSFSAAC
jgi:hypothetical protein